MLQRREVKTPSRNYYCPNYQNCLTQSINARSTGFECPRNCAHLGECDPPDAEEGLRAAALVCEIFFPSFPRRVWIECECPRCGRRYRRRVGAAGGEQRRFCADCSGYYTYLAPDPLPAALLRQRPRWPSEARPSELVETHPGPPLPGPPVAPAPPVEALGGANGNGGIGRVPPFENRQKVSPNALNRAE